ncbi:hypothetical protein VPNG_09364 [Cytospora leucostoma]|uniref:Zn(2)-C6 fungal-type domain-containing protein n=1 Tax=Cytospora leucostoma TaxID=1230097 RepID=A0A423VST9_9PEZI|nr:hypothetical protein VPNG_09364 [Cytospora leucostoma]
MNSSNSPVEKTKSGRSPTSCLECQRRKQKCSREWPCNHCQARKVPHLCQFASRKTITPESETSAGRTKLSRKRKEDRLESDSPALIVEPKHGLSDGLAKLGYMPSHGVFALARSSADPAGSQVEDSHGNQPEEIEAALKVILPKPYTDVLVQNYLERANFQYYPIFPEQLRGQSAKWWETRAAGQRLNPELTCLLLRVCAVSTQYLEDSLLQRLEFELGEKAQAMTERFHAAATGLSASIPRGKGGVVQVQQLFLMATWYKSEAAMIESWHALSVAVREAQEINMHKPMEGLPNFERELRKRLWCILWTWDWQMSTLLSRPLLIDQDDHKLEIPNGRLENINDPEIPHPLASVALQAELGLHVSHLFQKMSTEYSIQLVLETENELEKWMGTFPAALRDHRPDTRWDQKHPNIPFMRCQLNIIAYAYLLAPLKPYLLSTADPNIMGIQLGADLRTKAVDTCLDLMRTSEQFYELIFPASIKYFFIIFFMFDAATVMCSAIVHDVDYTLPKRNQCVRSLRTAQELMDGVAHLSESARLSALLLPPPDVPAEPDWLFMDYGAPTGLSITNTAAQSQPQQQQVVAMSPGDPLSGTFLEPLWDWDRLNLDLGQYAVPQYATSGSWI